jgi:hypothetical protein
VLFNSRFHAYPVVSQKNFCYNDPKRSTLHE